jgi:hypothetical protein
MISTFIQSGHDALIGLMDRFLIAHNPMSGNNQEAVVHTINPVAVFEVKDDRLMLLFCDSTDSEKIEKLTARAWHWYQSYKKWEK